MPEGEERVTERLHPMLVMHRFQEKGKSDHPLKPL